MITLSAAGVAISPAAAQQTVVIGGTGQTPVIVNMGAALPRTAPTATIGAPTGGGLHLTPPAAAQTRSRIVYGDEVITLIPPGSRPKKAPKPVMAKAPAPAPQTTTAVREDAPEAEAPATRTQAPAETNTAERTAPAQEKTQSTPTAEKDTAVPAPVKTTVATAAPSASEKAPAPAPKPQEATAPEQPKATLADKAEEKPVALVAEATPKNEPAPAPAPAPAVKEEAEVKSAAQPAPKPEAKPEPKATADKEMTVAALSPKETAPTAPVSQAPTREAELPVSEANRILFAAEETTLPTDAETKLKSVIAALSGAEDRVQLIAYADAKSKSAARRLSLGRALVVRSKLMELGLPNNKIEVRALGLPEDGGPADRVDLKLIVR